MPTSTAYCPFCQETVTLHFWASDVDPGDKGMLRDCGHGDFVSRYITIG